MGCDSEAEVNSVTGNVDMNAGRYGDEAASVEMETEADPTEKETGGPWNARVGLISAVSVVGESIGRRRAGSGVGIRKLEGGGGFPEELRVALAITGIGKEVGCPLPEKSGHFGRRLAGVFHAAQVVNTAGAGVV